MDLSCFGLELEMCVSDFEKRIESIEDYANVLQDIASIKNIPLKIKYSHDPRETDYGYWMATEDGSIRCNLKDESKIINKPKEDIDYVPIELVSPKTIYNPDEYGKFIDVLRDVILDTTFTYEVNKSQGMHINVSHPDQDKLNTLKAWWYFEPVIMSFIPPERRETKYAVSLRTIFTSLEELEADWENFYEYPDSSPAKYTALCVKKNRFEFRLVPAFMEFDNISAWLSFCIRFVFASIVKKIDYQKVSNFKSLFEFLDVSKEYQIKQIKEFFYIKTIRTIKELKNFLKTHPYKKITEVSSELIENVMLSKNKKDIKLLSRLNSIESIKPPPSLDSLEFLNFLARVLININWKKTFKNIEINNVEEFVNLNMFLSQDIPYVIFTKSFGKDIVEKNRYDILDYILETENKSFKQYLKNEDNYWFFKYLVKTNNLEQFELYLPLLKSNSPEVNSKIYYSLIMNRNIDFVQKLFENKIPLPLEETIKDIDKNTLIDFIKLYFNKFGERNFSNLTVMMVYLEDVKLTKEIGINININYHLAKISSYDFLALFLTDDFENLSTDVENPLPNLKMTIGQADELFDFLREQLNRNKVSFNFIKAIFLNFFKNYKGPCTNNLLEKYYQLNNLMIKKTFLFSLVEYGTKTLTPCQNKFLVENFDSSFVNSFLERISG